MYDEVSCRKDFKENRIYRLGVVDYGALGAANSIHIYANVGTHFPIRYFWTDGDALPNPAD
jgi:hypothetical protein